ncbi:LysR family transcriptional regulator [Erythrobacter colymbi]|uniref:LysR family transcriptional regulator n=1 Tax=Erythrobacter colymbi TaxID=1161202 RepID=UPI00138FD549|nr:LysR family transcriptional regulator [Erythrobacter colymbi]
MSSHGQRITIHELMAVGEVAARGNFRAAAKALGIAPSTLSQLVAKVEQELGIRLLNRTTRSVAPTEAGRMLLAQIGPALQTINQELARCSDMRATVAGTIRINASESATARIVPLIVAFQQTFPDVRLEFVSDAGLIDIVSLNYDAGIRLADAVPRDMIGIPLERTNRFLLVAAPSYLREAPPIESPVDLGRHECIGMNFADGRPVPWDLEHNGRAQRFIPSCRLRLGGNASLRAAALAGAGIAYIDEWTVRSDIGSGALIALLPEWTPAFDGLRLYYSNRRLPSAAFRAFIDFIRAHPVETL